MGTVSSSSTFSTSAATSHGMSGLVSGLDTEGMVESMLSGTQAKIDKQNAEKQQIIWKQEIYRNLISDINLLKSTFFSSTSSTNLGSADFFNIMNAVSSSQAVNVTASSSAATGRTSVQVGQLATAAKLQSSQAASGKVQGALDLAALDRKVVLKVGDDEVTLNLSAPDATKSEAEQMEALRDEINTQLEAQGVAVRSGINDDGKLEFGGGDFSVSAKSSQLGLTTLGLTAGQKTKGGALTTTADPDAALSFEMDLNGITRTITLDGIDSSSTREEIGKKLQDEIDDAFGKGWLTVGMNNSTGEFTINAKGKGNVATIGGGSALKLLGLQEGESNKIGWGQQLGDINFGTALQGGVYEFNINGVDFKFTSEDTMGDVMKKINASKAGVRVTYSDLEDKFTIESSNTGAGYQIKMSQKSGNLLNAMFGKVEGLATGDTVQSDVLTTDKLSGGQSYGDGAFEYGYFRLNVDGKDYSIYVPRRSAEEGGKYSRDEVMNLVNEGLAVRFGYAEDGKQNIEIDPKGSGQFDLLVRDGSKVTFKDEVVYKEDGTVDVEATSKKTTAAGGSLQLAFGFNKVDNVLKANEDGTVRATLGEVGLDVGTGLTGALAGLTNASTVDELMAAVKNAIENNNELGTLTPPSGESLSVQLKFEDGRLVVETNGEGELTFPPFLAAIFGNGSGSVSFNQKPAAGDAVAEFQEGQNALVTVNGIDLERSSNTFEVNGLTLSLQNTTGAYELGAVEGKLNEDGAWVASDGTVYQKNSEGYFTDGSNLWDADGFKLDAEGNRVFTGEDSVTINTTRNTEKIFEGVKSFVDKYNELIDKLNKLVDAKATYKDYAPLTDAQKKEMSDREIELWEEKAKEGLLRNDSSLETFLSSMRSILYSKPEGSTYALYDIGIETSSDWKDKGKLIIDESQLKTMIESDPQAIQELFTSAEGGLASLMSDTIDRTASISSGSPGSLVSLAGVEGRASSVSNTLTKRLISINSAIKDLQAKYEKEKARYWRQFNAMENALQSMNSQSNWLMQQFS